MNYLPDATVRVPAKGKDFFKWWLEVLKPYHSLTKREMDVAVEFLWYRFQLSKKISDPVLLERNAVNDDAKKAVIAACGVSNAHFQVIMGKLKKNKIFENGFLNPRFVPNLKEGEQCFQLLFLFDFR